MSSPSLSRAPPPRHHPGLAIFAALGCAWVFVLVTLGAFTTSIGAGMAFPDWPLSNGSLNPHGWLTNLSMFAEHSHRLSAGVMSTITVILAVWIWLRESRPWLRRLAWIAVGLVLLQAVVGGLRVLLEPDEVRPIATSVGELFAMLARVPGAALRLQRFSPSRPPAPPAGSSARSPSARPSAAPASSAARCSSFSSGSPR